MKFPNHKLPDLLYDSRQEYSSTSSMHQRYDTMLFAKAASILDQAVMDYESLNFSSSILAAAVFWKVLKDIPIEHWDPESTQLLYGIDKEKKLSPEDTKERKCFAKNILLIVSTGYHFSDIENCCKFLDNYEYCEIERILESRNMIELIQKFQTEGRDFRLEEDQIPCSLDPAKYGKNI
jgi:hypothetical protein